MPWEKFFRRRRRRRRPPALHTNAAYQPCIPTLHTKIDQNIVSYINPKQISENPLFRNGSKTNFSEMGLAQLDIYERYTQAVILCLHTWVFRVLLPLYFNSKGSVLVEIAVGIGKISVFQESDVFGLFWEVILGGSQEILLNILTKWLRILRKNVAMVLIKLLPNTFQLKSIIINQFSGDLPGNRLK